MDMLLTNVDGMILIDLIWPLLTLFLVCLNAAQRALPISVRKFIIPNPYYYKYQSVSPISIQDGLMYNIISFKSFLQVKSYESRSNLFLAKCSYAGWDHRKIESNGSKIINNHGSFGRPIYSIRIQYWCIIQEICNWEISNSTLSR